MAGLRDLGKTTLPVDKPTQRAFHVLSGDMPVAHYLRALAQRELRQRGLSVPLPGAETFASDATAPAMAADIKRSLSLLEQLNLAVKAGAGVGRGLDAGELAALEGSQLGFVTDAVIVETVKSTWAKVRAAMDAAFAGTEGSVTT
jgi:hypothetical protein